MAKLNRERRLIEKRVEKKARKDARKRAAADELAPSGDHELATSDAQMAPTVE